MSTLKWQLNTYIKIHKKIKQLFRKKIKSIKIILICVLSDYLTN